MNAEATANDLARTYSENRAELTLAQQELKRIGALLEALGRELKDGPNRVQVTATGLSPISHREVGDYILNENYVRDGLKRLQNLLQEHDKLRATMIEAGLGNLTANPP